MFSESVVKDWIVIGAASVSFILFLKFVVLHFLGNLLPGGAKTTVAAI